MNDSISPTGRIERKTYDTTELREDNEDWDTLSDDEKLTRIREADALDEEEVYNVTTERFHEYLVDNLHPGVTTDANLDAAWMGLGTDSATGTGVTASRQTRTSMQRGWRLERIVPQEQALLTLT